jgi:hypothetical protein
VICAAKKKAATFLVSSRNGQPSASQKDREFENLSSKVNSSKSNSFFGRFCCAQRREMANKEMFSFVLYLKPLRMIYKYCFIEF